jgi:phosphatidyl-myo-inositol dimannoside synthase
MDECRYAVDSGANAGARMRKILLVSEIFPPRTGGSGRWFWEIYRRLPRANVVVAAGETALQKEFDQAAAVRIERQPLTMGQWGIKSVEGLRGYWRGVRSLRKLIRAEQIGVLHAGRNLPEGLMARALKFYCGIPYIVYVHGEEVNTAGMSRELTWLTRRVFGGADFLIANSKNTAKILQDEWDQSQRKVRVLHPGVDTDRFVPAVGDPRVRGELGWGERSVVLTVGRLQLRKGQDQLILALPAIRQALPDVLYAIAGDGPERDHLQDLAKRTGVADCVQFLGEIDDDRLIACYQQCDLFVLPNRQVEKDIEGFGMVLLEAQACGKPVLAGTSGGTAETMKVPQTGRLVCCDGPVLLAEQVIELLKDRAQLARMGKAARQWVVEQFDWTPLARQAQDLFQQVGSVAG